MELQYVQGFFDRLCSVDVDGRAIVLTIQNVDLGRRVGARIHQEGIRCNIINMGDRIKLRVSSRASLEEWRKTVGFKDPDKVEKLDRILSSYGGGSEDR